MENKKWLYAAVLVVGVLMVFNQLQLRSINNYLSPSTGSSSSFFNVFSGSTDLKSVDVINLKSTAMTVKAVFPELDGISTADDAMKIMFPTGTPEYGAEMGVSFDDPVKSLDLMANGYPAMKSQIKQNPEQWQRYLSLAAAPKGISCEYCCGVGPQGVDSNGESKCGCQHNPAMQTITMWLIMNRPQYSDAELLREAMRWKTIFFPKNMIQLGLEVAGKSSSDLAELPGMVGGC